MLWAERDQGMARERNAPQYTWLPRRGGAPNLPTGGTAPGRPVGQVMLLAQLCTCTLAVCFFVRQVSCVTRLGARPAMGPLPFPAHNLALVPVPEDRLPRPCKVEGRFAPNTALRAARRLFEGQVQGSGECRWVAGWGRRAVGVWVD